MKDIAIIGIGLTLPQAESLDELWNILENGMECHREMPIHRQMDLDAYYQGQGEKLSGRCIPAGAYLEHVDYFDYEFFDIPYEEATVMEPAQRLLLQTIWRTIEDAGYTKEEMSDSNTGVYLGCSNSQEYRKYVVYDKNYNSYQPISAEYISDYLDLTGVSMKINTVCSSSLTAIHQACRAIDAGEMEMALVGGLRIFLSPESVSMIGIESADGRTRPFDISAKGFGGGEGVITILLKELSKAKEDRDHIHAIIKSSACNQDGGTVSLSAPNRESQTKVIRQAWKNANIDPSSISYIEAHGTGTQLGDVIEIEGITKAFENVNIARQFCGVGSVKSNFGHTEAVAGVLGILKVILAMKHKVLPPTLNFTKPNNYIVFPLTPVYVNTRLNKWVQKDDIYRAGVSSFGFTGTNSHIILERVKEQDEKHSDCDLDGYHILTISAKSKEALRKIINSYLEFNYEDKRLIDICYTVNTSREHFKYRLSVIFQTKKELIKRLKKYVLEGEKGTHKQLYTGYIKDLGTQKFQWPKEKVQTIIFWEKLARAYVKGVKIPWKKLYEKTDAKKLSLFPYPFDKKRCWINIEKKVIMEKYHTLFWEQIQLERNLQRTVESVILIHNNKEADKNLCNYLKTKKIEIIEVKMTDRREVWDECLRRFNSISSTEIIFFCNFWNEESSIIENGRQVHLGLQKLFQLSQVLGKEAVRHYNLYLISVNTFYMNQMDNSVGCGNSAFYGMGKAIQAEYQNITCSYVDTDYDCEAVWQELCAKSQDYAVGYRNRKRYIQKIKSIYHENRNVYEFKAEGAYILAGGLGDIGLSIAQAIVYAGGRHIVFITRSHLSDKRNLNKMEKLKEIENLGGTIQHYCADISDMEKLESVLKCCKNQYGKINGIMQLAGVGVGQKGIPIRAGSLKAFDESLKAKIQGSCNLLELTKEENYDFFLAMSSPITVTGGVNSSGYIASNSFLDTLCDYGRKINKNVMVLSPAPYKKTLSRNNMEYHQEMHLLKPLDTLDIIRAIFHAVSLPWSYTIVGDINYDSKLFYMFDVLPFSLDDNILKNYKEQSVENKEQSGKDLQSIHLRVTGMKSKFIEETDITILKIICSYLGYEEINLGDNFYEVGGDSLIALKITSKINETLGIQSVVSDLLKNPNFSKFLTVMKTKYNTHSDKEEKQSQNSGKEDYYPLSSAQKRVYLMSQRGQAVTEWNISYAMEVIAGELDINKLNYAFLGVLNRHEILRTTFHIVRGQVVQKVHPQISFCVEYIQDVTDIATHISQLSKSYDLSRLPLLRAVVVTTRERKTYFLFSIHHIISDEISMGIIMNELISLYRGNKLPVLKNQYKNYSLLQHYEYQRGVLQKDEDYWVKLFETQPAALELDELYKGAEDESWEGSRINFTIEKDVNEKIKNYAKNNELMSYWYLMALFQILLSKYSRKSDVVTGVTTTGRYHTRFDDTVGIFINVLPLRTYVDNKLSFENFLQRVKSNMISAYEHQKYPYDKLVELIQQKYHYTLDVNISFQMHKTILGEMKFDENTRLIPYDYPNKAFSQDILLEFFEDNDCMAFQLNYNAIKFSQKMMEVFLLSFQELLMKVIENPRILVRDLTGDESFLDEVVRNFLEPL